MLQLSQASGPISSRQIAESFVQLKGSPDDHRLEKDIVRRVGKAVAKLRQKGKVRTTLIKGNVKVHELVHIKNHNEKPKTVEKYKPIVDLDLSK